MPRTLVWSWLSGAISIMTINGLYRDGLNWGTWWYVLGGVLALSLIAVARAEALQKSNVS